MGMELNGKVALVTGGGVRLGRAFVEALAKKGASVAIHYHRSEAQARETLEQVEARGGRGALVQADLAYAAEAGLLLEGVRKVLGPVDVLVNSAAIFEPGGLLETGDEAWDRHHRINLKAPFILSRAFANQKRPGKIVNLVDWRALRPGADHFAYTNSKAGLAALTRSLAVALAPAVQVNALALGAILPPTGATEADLERIIAPVPGARWGSAEEAAQALIFLLEGPDYITGEIIYVDGGRHLV